MPQPINIGVSIASKQLRQTVETLLVDCPAARVFLLNEQTVGGFEPEILFIEDESGHDTPLTLTELRQTYPATAVVVISSNKDPEHIVRIMKAGGAEFLVEPVEKNQLLKAVSDIRSRLAATTVSKRGSIYTFINSKGGVGSTVLSVNTALALQRDKKARVALWDMNFQAGDSVVLLDVFPETTIIDICRGIQRLDNSLLKKSMVPHKSGIELLAAPTLPEDHDIVSASHVARILSVIGTLYDHVVIDCPSMSVNHSTMEAFAASDKIFVVIDLSIPAVRNASRLFDRICQAGISEQKIEFVVNRFADHGMLPIEEAEKNLNKKIYWLFPNNFDEVMSSINLGDPLITSNPGSTLAKSILTFVEKIKAPEQFKNTRSARNKRFFGDFFGR